MAILTVENIDDIADAQPTYVAATITTGDKFRNDDDNIAVWVKNVGIAKKMVIAYGRSSNFGTYKAKIVTIPTNVIKITQQFTGWKFNDVDGYVSFYFTDTTGDADDPGADDVTTVTIAAVRSRRY